MSRLHDGGWRCDYCGKLSRGKEKPDGFFTVTERCSDSYCTGHLMMYCGKACESESNRRKVAPYRGKHIRPEPEKLVYAD